MPGNDLDPGHDRREQVALRRDHLPHPDEQALHREDLLQLCLVRVHEDAVLERVDPIVDRGEAREEAVDEPVDDAVQQARRVVDGLVALDVALAEGRQGRRLVAVQRDQVAVGVEAVHLDEAVAVLVVGRAEDDEEDVAVVVVDLRPLVEPPRVLERERVEVELLAQDLEVGRRGLVDVEPEEAAVGEQLADPVTLEMEPVTLAAVDEVLGAR